VVGRKVKEGKVEVQSRHTGERWDVKIEEAIDYIKVLTTKDKETGY